VASTGATALSNIAGDIKTKLIELSNPANNVSQKGLLQNDLDALLKQAGQFVSESNFNGQNLLESGATDQLTVASTDGQTLTVTAQGGVGDATQEGLANIVDADLGRESARLAAQTVQSQLSTVAFGIANQQSSALLGLLR
jgi:flagellin-like hook-associated protein FlgL